MSWLKVLYRSARSTIFQSESVHPSKDCIDLLPSKAKALILQKIAEGLLQSVSKTRSVKFYFGLSMVRHCLWKMCATPGACIKPGCLARRPLSHKVNLPSSVARRPLCHKVNLQSSVVRRPLYHKVNLPSSVVRRPLWPLCHKLNLPSCVARRPLCHKVNLPRWEARQRHFIMTCDIYGTGQTNSLALCFVFGKTYKPAHGSAPQVTSV